MNNLYTIGESLIDFIPQEKNLQLKDVNFFERSLGGAPCNVACVYKKLTTNSSYLISCVGNDEFGIYIKEQLLKYGVKTDFIVTTNQANTSLAFVSLDQHANRSFVFYRNLCADLMLQEEDINFNASENDILHFCSLNLSTNNTIKAHKKAISIVSKNKGIISFDPNLRLNMWSDHKLLKNLINEFISLSHIVKISDDEIKFICDTCEEPKAAQQIFKHNPLVQIIIFTHGKNGASVYTRTTTRTFVNDLDVQVVDTTGAGDCFIGAVLSFIHLNNLSLNQLVDKINNLEFANKMLKFACYHASVSTTKKGALSGVTKLTHLYDL